MIEILLLPPPPHPEVQTFNINRLDYIISLSIYCLLVFLTFSIKNFPGKLKKWEHFGSDFTSFPKFHFSRPVWTIGPSVGEGVGAQLHMQDTSKQQ